MPKLPIEEEFWDAAAPPKAARIKTARRTIASVQDVRALTGSSSRAAYWAFLA